MNEATKTKAIAALEGMRGIVRREMLVRGDYVESEVSNPRFVGAICGGRKHCAIGSLWAGAGIKLKRDDFFGEYFYLPGVESNAREDFLRHRPALRLAYESLNAAARGFAEKHGLAISKTWASSAEGLFEGHYGKRLTKQDLLKVIAAAKRNVKAAA